VTHDQAWQRLPDLLEDRDDPELLDHVRACPNCQRQLFLLGRVDRLLRESAPARRLRRVRSAALAVAGLAVLAAVGLALLVPRGSHGHKMSLRSASGQLVAAAVMAHADGRNESLSLVARGLPKNRQHMFVFWAADGGSSMEVGRFMVDLRGACRVRFNLPANHAWNRFWISEPEDPATVVAST
jgi:hypothetical protein